MSTPRWLADLPATRRYALVGALSSGIVAGVVGLVLGLVTYAPTAWAATVEVGLPFAVLGAFVGLLAGAWTVRRSRSGARSGCG